VQEGDRHRIVIRLWGSVEISGRVNDRLVRHVVAIIRILTPEWLEHWIVCIWNHLVTCRSFKSSF
jgi:hypothetical protein